MNELATASAELEYLPTGDPILIDLGGGQRRGSTYQGPIRDPGPQRRDGSYGPKPARPRWVATARHWLTELARELRRQGGERGSKRSANLLDCTRYSRGRVCRCGSPRPGRLGDQSKRCHARSCPRCGPVRAYQLRDRIRDWLASDEAPQQLWYHVVITRAYQPWNPEHLTPEAIRGRLDSAKRDWRKLWRKLKKAGAVAALVGSEIGRWGEVHLHAYVCTDLRPELPDTTGGFVWVSPTPINDPAHGVGELVKYSAKTPSRRAEWWSNPKLVPSPALVAAWELACWGSRLIERYGSARKLPEAKTDPDELTRDEPPCPECGRSIDEAETRLFPTGIWVRWCASKKVAPFGERLQE